MPSRRPSARNAASISGKVVRWLRSSIRSIALVCTPSRSASSAADTVSSRKARYSSTLASVSADKVAMVPSHGCAEPAARGPTLWVRQPPVRATFSCMRAMDWRVAIRIELAGRDASRYAPNHGMAGRRHRAVGAAARRDRRHPECPDLRARAASRAGQGRDRAAGAAVPAAGQPAGAGLEGAAAPSISATSRSSRCSCSAPGCSTTRCASPALAAAAGLLDEVLAEREPHPRLYAGLLKLLEGMLADPRWLET